MKINESGVYLVHGTRIVAENDPALTNEIGPDVSKDAAKQGTIAYRILKDHNRSGNMEDLSIRFDKLTSHDITFVGIIQTARASGLTKFPMPYVLTNCHNSLCQKVRRRLCTAASGRDPSICTGDACGRRQDDPRL